MNELCHIWAMLCTYSYMTWLRENEWEFFNGPLLPKGSNPCVCVRTCMCVCVCMCVYAYVCMCVWGWVGQGMLVCASARVRQACVYVTWLSLCQNYWWSDRPLVRVGKSRRARDGQNSRNAMNSYIQVYTAVPINKHIHTNTYANTLYSTIRHLMSTCKHGKNQNLCVRFLQFL